MALLSSSLADLCIGGSNRRLNVKFLDVTFRQPDEMLHPMQAFIRYEDVVRYEELRTWNLLPEEPFEYELFYVVAPERDRYREQLDGVESVLEYDLTPIDDDSFYVYACQETRDDDRLFREAFAALELVVEPPIVYDAEAAMRMTLVGDGENLRTLLENVPEPIETGVHEIGEYDRREGAVAGALTDRQREAVAAAVECGYYEVPRTGSIEAVAGIMGCAPSTASNHLQKAESAVMTRLVARRGLAR